MKIFLFLFFFISVLKPSGTYPYRFTFHLILKKHIFQVNELNLFTLNLCETDLH